MTRYTNHDPERDDYDETPEFSREGVSYHVWASFVITFLSGSLFVGSILACANQLPDWIYVCFFSGTFLGTFAVWLHYVNRKPKSRVKDFTEPFVAKFTEICRVFSIVVLVMNLLVGTLILIYFVMDATR